MKQVENNAYFWQKLDSLYFSSSIVIDYPKDAPHPKYDDLYFPVDYGHLRDTLSSEAAQVDVFFGTDTSKKINSIAISTDILKRDCEIKLLIGCTEKEEQDVMHMLNISENQKAILVRRSSETTGWEEDE